MDRRIIRDRLNYYKAIMLLWLYFPHLLLYLSSNKLRRVINTDLDRRKEKVSIKLSYWKLLIYYLHNDKCYRNLFYHRTGPVFEMMFGWLRPAEKYFLISKSTKIGEGAYMSHPFSTVINAKIIGKNFSCRHLTTLGNKVDGDNDNRPIIGDNVTLGVNVTIIGSVHIGNNVVIGAGAVVVKDIPDNCIAVGNPCKPIKFL